MIAQLAMYDWPEERAAFDGLWAQLRDALRREGFSAPDNLDREQDPATAWLNPDLLLGQTCGMPYRLRLSDHVRLVGTFDAALPGAEPGFYYSQIVARADDPGQALSDFADKRLAINAFDSQSGWASIGLMAENAGVRFGDIHVTGAHAESARAVAENGADIAAIDAVTWILICRHQPAVARALKIVGRTEPTPGLPLITSTQHDAKAIADAVEAAVASLPYADRQALNIYGFQRFDPTEYLVVANPALPENARTTH